MSSKKNNKYSKTLQTSYLVVCFSFFLVIPFSIQASESPCKTCHISTEQAHQKSPHEQAKVTCENCHGDGSDHIKAPNSSNIATFSSKSKATTQQQEVCSDCHSNSHSKQPNVHRAAGITCSNCHSVHNTDKQPATADDFHIDNKYLSDGSSMCFDCHQDSFTQFEFNERHRLDKGVLTCSSCHDPHNPTAGNKLGGFKQSMCGDCHADVEGPFVHEHAASRVEGCASCHEPHGSPNRHMLKFQQVGALCYSCHADVPQFHVGFSPSAPVRFDQDTVCTNCHVTIHGSNIDKDFLR